MYIHREGRNAIVATSIIMIMAALSSLFLPVGLICKTIVILPFVILFLLIVWFFRIPARRSRIEDNSIIAPADGKIVVVEKITESEYFNDERTQISIFMSPLNIHQNTYPLGGKITYMKYHKGNYLVAWHPKSSTLNERTTIVIKHKSGTEIMVRQIAGAVARRICTYSKTGADVNQCGELGFIKFGSRVDIILPLSAKIECSVNQISRNKLTKIAQLV
ncbi:Phosphatidylserine decarboxylase proenzyme [subsurface metagenome]